MSDDVTASVIVDGGCSGPNRTTMLRLAWSRRDPLAVRLVLTAVPDHPALPRGTWAVLREFLRYGCDHPTGDGLVRVRPERDAVVVELVEGKRTCLVRVKADVVRGFLDATEAICPSGEEPTTVDAEIDKLLRT